MNLHLPDFFEIIHVDVTKGRSSKDYGKGFYMAVSMTQAIGMMHKKYRETLRRNFILAKPSLAAPDSRKANAQKLWKVSDSNVPLKHFLTGSFVMNLHPEAENSIIKIGRRFLG